MKLKFATATLAALALAFLPTASQAATATVSVLYSGTSITPIALADGDALDVKVGGSIAKTGLAVQELYSAWSTQSLQLDISDLAHPEDDLVWPEGWDLEYTTDGTNWVNWYSNNPSSVAQIQAIRAVGDVNTVGSNTYKTSSTGSLVAASFQGSGGGDGYNVAIGNNMVFNFWHHQVGAVTMECHTFTGSLCDTPTLTVEGYSSNHASSAYAYPADDKVYAFVLNDSTSHFGVLCFDYSVSPAESCGFTELETYGASEGWNQDIGSSSQDGNVIWTINGNSGELLCFDISTGVACPSNNFYVGTSGDAFYTGRVTATNGLVFFTLNNSFGCYNPATDDWCDSTPRVLSAGDPHAAPLPIEDADGNFLGACDIYSALCLNDQGNTFSMPSSLQDFFAANPVNWDVAGQNAEQFATAPNRFYFETTNDMLDWGSNTVTCFDFTTQTACEGFNGYIDDAINMYTVSYSGLTPDCVWVNGDAGSIIPLQYDSGDVGCRIGNPVINLPYTAVTPRLSCQDEGRIINWDNFVVSVPAGVSMSDVRVSFFDSEDNALASWTNLQPSSAGVLDLTGLSSNDTGSHPTIQITAGDITNEQALAIEGTATFTAENPELCFTLSAANFCEVTVDADPLPGSIANGIIESTSITRPASGKASGSTDSVTLAGVNPGSMCASSALYIPLPTDQLAETGSDSGNLALTGFLILSMGAALVVFSRRLAA